MYFRLDPPIDPATWDVWNWADLCSRVPQTVWGGNDENSPGPILALGGARVMVKFDGAGLSTKLVFPPSQAHWTLADLIDVACQEIQDAAPSSRPLLIYSVLRSRPRPRNRQNGETNTTIYFTLELREGRVGDGDDSSVDGFGSVGEDDVSSEEGV